MTELQPPPAPAPKAISPAAPPDPALPPLAPPVAHLQLKAGALLLLLLLLVCGAVGYLMYARGLFESHRRLVLVADDSEGVVVGMDLTFSGFAIGRVRNIELAPDGNARIVIDVPQKDAHWLRSSSVFTLVRGLVGNTNLRAYSGQLSDPPLPDGAERKVLAGDATAEIPKLVAAARELVQNLGNLITPEGPLGASLRQVQAATEKLNGPHGALGLLLGSDADAGKLITTLERSNALLAQASVLLASGNTLLGTGNKLLARADGLTAKADTQVFGPDGLLRDTRGTVLQLNALLADARASLQRVDAVLAEAQGAAANARSATTDLGTLRSEVEASLRRVQQLLDEVNRKWPFARDTQIKLP